MLATFWVPAQKTPPRCQVEVWCPEGETPPKGALPGAQSSALREKAGSVGRWSQQTESLGTPESQPQKTSIAFWYKLVGLRFSISCCRKRADRFKGMRSEWYLTLAGVRQEEGAGPLAEDAILCPWGRPETFRGKVGFQKGLRRWTWDAGGEGLSRD